MVCESEAKSPLLEAEVPFETDLQKMARHFVDTLDKNKEIIVTEGHNLVFEKVAYGEPRTVAVWPFCSVQAIAKTRELRTTRKFGLGFEIHILLYHGKIAEASEIQEETHRRVEALERFIQSDRKWNYVDRTDTSKDKVIHGQVILLDHPVVIAGDELWSASRLQLSALSEEYFTSVND